MKDNIIATEKFFTKHRNYFFDFRKAVNNKNFINLVCTEKQPDNTYKRACIMIFEDHFEFLIEALSSLFSNAAHEVGQRDKPAGSQERAAGIKSWDVADRPREKLLELGRAALSDAELLAMLI
ncbi:UPF0758 domain-containing protein, partial [Mucilaginibacter polytrichastri]